MFGFRYQPWSFHYTGINTLQLEAGPFEFYISQDVKPKYQRTWIQWLMSGRSTMIRMCLWLIWFWVNVGPTRVYDIVRSKMWYSSRMYFFPRITFQFSVRPWWLFGRWWFTTQTYGVSWYGWRVQRGINSHGSAMALAWLFFEFQCDCPKWVARWRNRRLEREWANAEMEQEKYERKLMGDEKYEEMLAYYASMAEGQDEEYGYQGTDELETQEEVDQYMDNLKLQEEVAWNRLIAETLKDEDPEKLIYHYNI